MKPNPLITNAIAAGLISVQPGTATARAATLKIRNAEIRRLYAAGWLQQSLAEKFNLSLARINQIINRKQ